MAKNETTSADIATLAARALRKPGSISKAEIKSLAGAALTQVADRVKDLVAVVTPAAKIKPAAKPRSAPKSAPKASTPKAAAKRKSTGKSVAKTATKPAKAKTPKPKKS